MEMFSFQGLFCDLSQVVRHREAALRRFFAQTIFHFRRQFKHGWFLSRAMLW